MYSDTQIQIPPSLAGITRKTINSITYIYYNYGRAPVPGRKYTAPKNVCIGKLVPGTQDRMFPNEHFAEHFPDGFVPDDTPALREAARQAAKQAAEKAESYNQDRLALLRLMELCRSLYRNVRISEQEIRNLKQRIRNLGQKVPPDFPVLDDNLPEVPSTWLE